MMEHCCGREKARASRSLSASLVTLTAGARSGVGLARRPMGSRAPSKREVSCMFKVGVMMVARVFDRTEKSMTTELTTGLERS